MRTNYFKGVNSLEELKKQYRKLAMELHPDRGGDEARFKEMGNEFSLLYETWKNHKDEDGTVREENRTTETCEGFTASFYEEQGWTGSRFEKHQYDKKEIVKDIRDYCKKKYPDCVFSVRMSDYVIYVSLMRSPYKVFNDDTAETIHGGSRLSIYHLEEENLTAEIRKILSDVLAYVQSFNYDHGNSYYDYFDVNFYVHMEIGKREKPYERAETLDAKGKASKANARKEGPAHAAIRKAMNGNTFDYAEKYTGRDDTSGRAIYAKDIEGGKLYGSCSFYRGVRGFDVKTYSQPTVARRVKEKLASVGVITEIVSGGWCLLNLRFIGYTPEVEARLAAEDKAAAEEAARESTGSQKQETAPKAEGNAAGITIEDYSEKAFAVFGDTRRYAELLKDLGGKFNRNLRGRAGWIFSKKRESAVREAFSAA